MYTHFSKSEHVEYSLFKDIKNDHNTLIKPLGGLWACPSNSANSWELFCEDIPNRLNPHKINFTLVEDASIIKITNLEQTHCLPKIDVSKLSPMQQTLAQFYIDLGVVLLDYEQLKTLGFHGIEISLSSDPRLINAFHGWDVDTLLVFYPWIVREVGYQRPLPKRKRVL